MRVADLYRYGIRYIIAGCVIAVLVAIAFFVGYKIIYQKLLHGTKKLGSWKAVWIFVFVIYGVVLLGATFFSRGGYYAGMRIMPPFSSYREAWYQGKASDVRNIIINILLFIPLGFLIPLGVQKLKVFWKTYLTGFIVTLVIECLQLVTRRGIFECDDILNNLVGTMIGYGIFAIWGLIICRANKPKKVVKVLAYQIPLIVSAVVILTVCLLYEKQELGNLDIHYITKISNSKYDIVSNLVYDENKGKAPVYKVKEYSLEETRLLAEKILEKAGTNVIDNETDIYDETVFYKGEQKSISIDYKGGFYHYIDFDATFPEDGLTEKNDATEEEIKTSLAKLGVDVPEGSEFENSGKGNYTFTTDAIEIDGNVYDGHLICTYMEDGSFADIYNKIYVCEGYKEFDIISEKQAFQQILNGEFRFYFEGSKKETITVEDVYLGYMLDSKSFYQPVYFFDVLIEGEEYQIQIPALD